MNKPIDSEAFVADRPVSGNAVQDSGNASRRPSPMSPREPISDREREARMTRGPLATTEPREPAPTEGEARPAPSTRHRVIDASRPNQRTGAESGGAFFEGSGTPVSRRIEKMVGRASAEGRGAEAGSQSRSGPSLDD